MCTFPLRPRPSIRHASPLSARCRLTIYDYGHWSLPYTRSLHLHPPTALPTRPEPGRTLSSALASRHSIRQYTCHRCTFREGVFRDLEDDAAREIGRQTEKRRGIKCSLSRGSVRKRNNLGNGRVAVLSCPLPVPLSVFYFLHR